MNYGQLKTAIADFAHRADQTANMPTYIQLAQARINTDVRCPEQITKDVLDDSDRNIDGTYNLPANYLQVIEITATSNGTAYTLESEPLQELYRYRTSGRVAKFSIYSYTAEFRATPGVGSTMGLTYYKREAAFTLDADVSTLLTNHPALYLDGALIELHKNTQDLELSADALQRFTAYADKLNASSNRQRGRMSPAGPYNMNPVRTGGM